MNEQAGRPGPAAVRGRPPQEVSYFVNWMVFLMILAIVVAWFIPLRALVEHWLWRPVEPGPRTSHQFVALAYPGVSDKPNEIDPARFREHLGSLARAGYRPISLRDVQALYRDGRPLPERAVLLTFEHGRRSSYFGVKRDLQRAGWNAVMFLWVGAIEEKDPASLRWPYVRNLVRSRNWEIAGQSFEGFLRIPRGPSGRVDNFLTTPMWLAAENRHETVGEFQDRLRADHERTLRLIERRTGERIAAFAYPFGDFGQYRSGAPLVPAVNLALAGRYYDVAFLAGNLALNTRHSDPRRLNRLLVRPEWTGEDLVAALDRSWPDARAAEDSPAAWVVDWGAMALDAAGRLRLAAASRTTGAQAWLAGSDLARDYHARVVFRIERGRLAFYLRAAPDRETYVYIGVEAADASADGEGAGGLWVRQKEVGGEPFTLGHSAVRVERGREHALDIYLRDRILFAVLDGEPVFADSLRLHGSPRPGMFGVSVWAPEVGRAVASVDRLRLRPQTPALASWVASPDGDAAAVRWVHRNAHRLTDISPRWKRTAGGGVPVPDNTDFELYRALARIHRLGLHPRLSVEDQRGLGRIAPSHLADQVSETGADGLFLDFSALAASSLPRLAGWLQQCAETLAVRGLSLMIQLPRSPSGGAGMTSLLAVAPDARPVVASADRQLASVAAAAVTREEVPDPDELPLTYTIPGLAEAEIEDSEQGRAARLQQIGMAAFQDGEYERADRAWSEWAEMEPDNPRAWMLLGDADVRLGRPERALERYARSLEIDPGQVSLALRRAQLLDDIGRPEEAVRTLNLYGRLFPDQDRVRLAQIEWLIRKHRVEEALDLARRLGELSPGNLDALAFLLRLEDDPAARQRALERLMRLGSEPDRRLALGDAIRKHDLLSLPDVRPLIRLAAELARTPDEPQIAGLFSLFGPLAGSTVDTFEHGGLSPNWVVEGGTPVVRVGRLFLSASERNTEAAIRLQGSVLACNGFVECIVSPGGGSFWLFARRSGDALVRFGYSGERLYLQAWRHGRIVSQSAVPWGDGPASVRLALEVSGRGAMGYVNGRPAFDAPIHVPRSIGRGWLGVAAHDPERGTASAEIRALAAGPLAPRLAIPGRAATETEAEERIRRLRPVMQGVTALCPEGWSMDLRGNLVREESGQDDLWRLFASYHRVAFLPSVRVPAGAVVDPILLLEKIRDLRADGFLLLFEEAPGADRLARIREVFADSEEALLAGHVSSDGKTVHLRPMGSGPDLFGGSDAEQILPMLTDPEPAPALPGARRPAVLRY